MENPIKIISTKGSEKETAYKIALEIAEKIQVYAEKKYIGRFIGIPPPGILRNPFAEFLSDFDFQQVKEPFPMRARRFAIRDIEIGMLGNLTPQFNYFDCAEYLEKSETKYILLIVPKDQKIKSMKKIPDEEMYKNMNPGDRLFDLHIEILKIFPLLFKIKENYKTEAVFVIGY